MFQKYFTLTLSFLLGAILFLLAYELEFFANNQWILLFVIIFFVYFSFLYPRKAFWFFLVLISLETVRISPDYFLIDLRPFQVQGIILGVVTMLTVYLSGVLKKNIGRVDFSFLKVDCFFCRLFGWKFCYQESKEDLQERFNPFDRLVFVLGLVSLFAWQYAPVFGVAVRMSGVLFSFLFFYWLVRNFIRTKKEFLEAVWFLLVGSLPVLFFSFYQLVAFRFGWEAFAVMDERVNGTFAEPDWLGIYLVFVLAMFLVIRYLRMNFSKATSGRESLEKLWSDIVQPLENKFLGDVFLLFLVIVLVATVSRSAWLGGLMVVGVFCLIVWLKGGFGKFVRESLRFALLGLMAILFLWGTGLSKFHLGNRAISSFSGWQKITVSCQDKGVLVEGEKIESDDILQEKKCRHINLEEINSEKQKNKVVLEVYRPDPNVTIRKNIYQKTFLEIKKHWLFGVGLGGSSFYLGNDNLGHGLNASNIFLEIFWSLGLVGFLPFFLIFLTPFVFGLRLLQIKSGRYAFFDEEFFGVFALLTFFAFLVPNLFNAGFFLSVFWVWLALVGGLFKILKK